MAEDDFNMSMRKFLKVVGVTSQQQIEEHVRTLREGRGLPPGPFKARVTLTVEALDLIHTVEGEIASPEGTNG